MVVVEKEWRSSTCTNVYVALAILYHLETQIIDIHTLGVQRLDFKINE